ncbi:MAG: translation initiation factor IF-2 [Alphaproteobacteria bacterium]|nr:translation initiation factor IF-2 [Alphaproteobacteria bacterium]
MTDANDSTKKETLKVANPGRLQLTKTIESGKVKQNFTHGRSKTVTVEVRKTRTFAQGAAGMVEVKAGSLGAGQHGGHDDDALRHLTPEERQSRMKALKIAEEQMKLAAEQAKAKAQTQAEAPVMTAQTVIARDEDLADASGIVKPKKPIIPSRDKKPAPAAAPTAAPAPLAKPAKAYSDGDEVAADKPAKGGKLKLKGAEDRWSSGKITVQNALSSLEDQRVRSLASMRRQREKAMKKATGAQASTEKVIREVVIPEAITVQELSNRMAERVVDVIKVLMKLGMMVTATQSIDADTAELVVGEFGHKFKRVAEGDVENVLKDEDGEDDTLLTSRPPVVTIMGHVDHGKTSLLDALRKTNVVEGEAGGITQHIGAYQVEVASGQKVTFLDTPGHEAFTAMRARGAKITDIVVLVVAADDGIMEQTKEAISHAKAAGVPIVVAVNKIDKPGADVARVKQELMQYELISEEFGGETMVVGVSAKTGENLDKLVETLLLQAEVLELKANPNRVASGVVVEAKLDQGKGVVTTLLIQKGTLKAGDIVVAGPAYGRVRSIIDDKGQAIKEAMPGMPAMILGLSQAPEAGDVFSVVENEKTARDIAEYRARRIREQAVAASARTIDNLFGAAAGTNAKELPVIIKGDVQGSVEAIAGSVAKYTNEEVAVKVLHSGVGAITESDVTLSKATGAMIIAFNVRAAPKAKEMAGRDKVNIRYYSVIYDVVDDVKAALSGMLSPTKRENFLGYAEIREVFNISKVGKVAGCMVTEGVIKRGCKVRLLRDNVVIHEGTLKTLKRFKDEVKEVKGGMECGMAFENYDDIRQSDQIECFEVEELARTV